MSRTMDDGVWKIVVIQRLGITGHRRERLGLCLVGDERAAALENDLRLVGRHEPHVKIIG
jgi:hypothetical protein